MNFAAFQKWRENQLREKPNLLDCSETNLYRALAQLRPPEISEPSNRTVHRCDVARIWLRRYEFSESFSRHALVCRGVRHALGLIFSELARTNAILWTPGDVYPAYLELARASGIEPRVFPTLPEPKLPSTSTPGVVEYLLIANPWKPLGRFITTKECDALTNWLQDSSKRFLLIDCVYDLGSPFHVTTQKLQQTGRAIILHSVTKGWLWPKTFGIALLGDANSELVSAFRNDPPSQDQLRQGERFLSNTAHLPDQVITALNNRKEKLLATLPENVANSCLLNPFTAAPGCYFFPVRQLTDELLQQHKIIAIPSSAFGASWAGSILTSLSESFIPVGNGVGP